MRLLRRHGPAIGLAALMGGSGVLHFTATAAYARIVPHALPRADAWVQASGAAELAIAALLLHPRTRRRGGMATVALLLVVFPANIQMAIDGGISGAGFPMGSALVAWARLPLQVPLILWAWAVAGTATRGLDSAERPAHAS